MPTYGDIARLSSYVYNEMMTTYSGIGDAWPVRSTRGLGAAVRARRRELGLSQATLAGRAGVSRQWISYVEAGKPTVELGRVLQVLEALGVEVRLHAAEGAGGSAVDLDALLDDHRADG